MPTQHGRGYVNYVEIMQGLWPQQKKGKRWRDIETSAWELRVRSVAVIVKNIFSQQ
jgi:hypothetical protein